MEKGTEAVKDILTDQEERFRLLALVEGAPVSAAIDKLEEDEVEVWPHLVFRELLCILAVVVFFIVVSTLFNAPLEGLANPTETPNPAKAPWYFVGLQELLVYFDPWIAGVALPTLIIVGLMAIPYVDFGRESADTYSFSKRKSAVTVFTFGLALWFTLILVGTFFRGPSWVWYWPWESWEIHKPVTGETRNLPALIGAALIAGYFALGLAIPTMVLRRLRERLGWIRFGLVFFLLLSMVGVAAKIVLRLVFNVKYILATPWFNI